MTIVSRRIEDKKGNTNITKEVREGVLGIICGWIFRTTWPSPLYLLFVQCEMTSVIIQHVESNCKLNLTYHIAVYGTTLLVFPCIFCLYVYFVLFVCCLHQNEIKMITGKGNPPTRIIYANTRKQPSHLRYAESVGVKYTTVDDEDELHKIKQNTPNMR